MNEKKTEDDSPNSSSKRYIQEETHESKCRDSIHESTQTSSSASSSMSHKRGNIPSTFERRKKIKGLQEDIVNRISTSII